MRIVFVAVTLLMAAIGCEVGATAVLPRTQSFHHVGWSVVVVAGYVVANDFGLHDFRDTDRGSMLRVKGTDTIGPVGPGLVRGWDFRDKRLRTRVNGEVVQDASTDEMIWDMHYLVADLARNITLVPGDLILSGTPSNSRPVAET